MKATATHNRQQLPASASYCFAFFFICDVILEMFLSIRSWKVYWCLRFYAFSVFNHSIYLALPLLLISGSFSAGQVSFLGVTMATMGSLYPFQCPHRFTTTSAWSKTSSFQVKRVLHGEWRHISSSNIKHFPRNSEVVVLIELAMQYRESSRYWIWQENVFTEF